jgi:hypothetical protein
LYNKMTEICAGSGDLFDQIAFGVVTGLSSAAILRYHTILKSVVQKLYKPETWTSWFAGRTASRYFQIGDAYATAWAYKARNAVVFFLHALSAPHIKRAIQKAIKNVTGIEKKLDAIFAKIYVAFTTVAGTVNSLYFPPEHELYHEFLTSPVLNGLAVLEAEFAPVLIYHIGRFVRDAWCTLPLTPGKSLWCEPGATCPGVGGATLAALRAAWQWSSRTASTPPQQAIDLVRPPTVQSNLTPVATTPRTEQSPRRGTSSRGRIGAPKPVRTRRNASPTPRWLQDAERAAVRTAARPPRRR